jgi:hypothetical protein
MITGSPQKNSQDGQDENMQDRQDVRSDECGARKDE